MKKMNAKEFKEALDKAYFYKDIFRYEDIINMIIRILYADARDMEAHNNKNAAYHAKKQADILYDILDKRGYYGLAHD